MTARFQEILDALNNPAMRHAMLVHMPIVLSMLSVAFTLMAAILPRNKTCRWFALVASGALVVAAYVAAQSGEGALNAAGAAESPEVYQLLNDHEEMAEKIWLFGLVIAALVAVSMSSKRWLQTSAAWLAFLASVALANWVGITAHLGGTLVYAHGVGTPTRAETHTLGASSSPTHPADPKVAFFRAEIAPILADSCFKCHNPSRAGRSGKLDQTTREGMLKGGRSGPAIVPGKPEESVLIKRVRGVDPEEDIMPPDNPLPEEAIKRLEQWIRDGAVWPDDVKPAATAPSNSPGN